jgi:POT family proton-dependent oligopeptide transporter
MEDIFFKSQGSKWTFQANRMSGKLWGNYSIMPDQFQFITRVLILILIPLFDQLIYPSLGKCNLLKKPLHRILCGGILAGISFLIAALVEMEIIRQNEDFIKLHMMWQFPQYFLMTVAEVMFQITGMEFSYSEAPVSMKSLMQAIWILTAAFGNILVIAIERIHLLENPVSSVF